MKILRIVSVFLVISAGAAGYLYSLQFDGPTSETDSAETTREREESNPDADSQEMTASDESSGTSPESYESHRARVLEVFDGDTIKARFLDSGRVVRIRLKGIDCPESSRDVDKCWSNNDLIDIPCPEQVPLGKRATEYAEDELAGQTVRLESYDGFKKGDYGRTLAYIRTPDGKDYSLKTIKRGFCKDSGVRYDHPRDDRYEPHRRPIDR